MIRKIASVCLAILAFISSGFGVRGSFAKARLTKIEVGVHVAGVPGSVLLMLLGWGIIPGYEFLQMRII